MEENEILVENVEEIETPEEAIKVEPEIIPTETTKNPLMDGLQVAAYSAGIMLATTVMVNAGGVLLNAAGKAVGKGAKWLGGKVASGLEARKEKKLLKSQKEETSEEETENED